MRSLLQRIPGIYAIFFLTFLFWGPLYTPISFSFFYLLLHILFINNNFRTAYGIYSLHKAAVKPYIRSYSSSVSHIIIIPNYKESMETLTETLDVLASHEQALSNYSVVLAMEGSEAQAVVKAKTLVRMYQDHFALITFTIHPPGLEGEVRGKSSNVCWAVSEIDKKREFGENAILTIMDSDTCFAQDYFLRVSDAYFETSKEDRGIVMFMPPTIFDRNADSIPAPVRVADMMWSGGMLIEFKEIGVISHMYEGSVIKFPCSAYSLSLKLARNVGFWDVGTDSIGEDMHMYLKCFFSTHGQLIVKTILSPASQCNVEGSNYWDTIVARYSQSVRHMWGSLDIGYTIRRTIFGFLKPGYDLSESGEVIEVPMASDLKSNQFLSLPLYKVLVLFLRMSEAQIYMGHIFALVFITGAYVPVQGASQSFLWSLFSASAPHPLLLTALSIGSWLRLVTAFPLVTMLYFYEKYHQWGSSGRWERGNSLLEVSKAKYLGNRPSLVSIRSSPWYWTDWLYIPISGLLYLTSSQLHAHLLQLFTNRLDYKVAAKPVLDLRPISQIELITSEISEENEDGAIRSSRFFVEDENSSVSHGDSGFFEFEPDGTLNNNSPRKKKNSNLGYNRPTDIMEDRTSWTVSV